MSASFTWPGGPSLPTTHSPVNHSVLYAVLSVKPVPLTRLDELNNELIAFERNIPFNLRCRAAVEAIASVYSDVAKARLEAPEVTRRAVRLVLEQHFLAMIVSETVVNLYRQLFVRALAESPDDPVRSVYGRPFLSVFERSVVSLILCYFGPSFFHPCSSPAFT